MRANGIPNEGRWKTCTLALLAFSACGAPGINDMDPEQDAAAPVSEGTAKAGTLDGADSSRAAARSVPAKIEAEAYTTMSGIGLQPCSEGTQNVAWIDSGDWMDYTIQVSTAGSYILQYRVASPYAGGIIASSYNSGANQLGTVAVPNTGGWQNWRTISATVTLTAGTHKLAVFAQSGRFNLNWINIVSANGSATNVPGKLEAESYTSMSGVQLEDCSEGTQNVGWIETGDWMDYAIRVSTAGNYTVQYRVASPYAGGIIASSYNSGANQLGTIGVPNTGGWQNWQTISQTVTLPVGTYNLRLLARSGGFNLQWISISKDAPPASDQVFTLAYHAAPADNPLKGFMPYQGSYAFPHSLEWFYIPLKDIQTDYNTFNWTSLDSVLKAIANRGHQAVFRVYVDYPNTPYGLPGFLSHVPKYFYTEGGNGSTNTSYCPDYRNADLQRALLNFISALGARYDHDPRIAFITAGLLGFWGEWHTFPHDWMPPAGFMDQVLDVYESAFPNTLILLREPKSGVDMNHPRLGFHDDSFAYQTLGPTNWHFWPRITAAGLQDSWKSRPIGGEVRPEVQGCIWDDYPCTPAGQGFNTCVTTAHASWMMNHKAFVGQLGQTQIQRAISGAQSLGYTFHVPKATLSPLRTGQALHGTVTVENRGVAPFYYPWTVQVAVLDHSGQVRGWSMNWDLRTVLPGSPVTWTLDVRNHGLASGTYTLLIGVMNPMAGGHPLKFANTTQDQHRNGWLSLGTFTVQP